MSGSPILDGGALDRFLIAVLALLVDALLAATAAWLPAPVPRLQRGIAWLDRRLNRPQRAAADLLLRGLLVGILALGAAAFAGLIAERAARLVPLGWLIHVGALVLVLEQRRVFAAGAAVARSLRLLGGSITAARAAAAALGERDAAGLDQHAVAATTVDAGARRLSRAVVAPIFWYLLLGLPGAFAHIATDRLQRTLAPGPFGRFGHACFAVTAFLPARLAALLFTLSALGVPNGRADGALRTARRDAARCRPAVDGWPVATAAGALGLALPAGAGDRTLWIGEGRARLTQADVQRALLLFGIAAALHGGLVLIAGVAIAGR